MVIASFLVRVWEVISSVKRKPITPEEKEIVVDLIHKAEWLIIGVLIFMPVTAALVLTGVVPLTPAGFAVEDIEGSFVEQVRFACQYLLLHATWLFYMVMYVVAHRIWSGAIDPTSGHEDNVYVGNKILTNSLEQSVISIVAQLTFLAVASPSGQLVSRLIPLINVYYAIGRLAFFFGYPRRRLFGMVTGLSPVGTLIGATWIIAFGKLFGIYTINV